MKSMRMRYGLIVAIAVSGLPVVAYGQVAAPPVAALWTDADCRAGGFNCVSQTVTFSQGAPQQDRVKALTYTFGPGWSLGNSGGWRVFHSDDEVVRVANRGIAQVHGSEIVKHASGDTANYFYVYSDGGSTAQSDEGIEPLAVNGGETHGYFHGTVAGTTGLGDTVPRLAFTSGNNWTTDEARLLDITRGTIAGNLNGSSVFVVPPSPRTRAILPALPVTNELPLTTAWCQLSSAIPSAGGAATQATLRTVGCIPNLIGARVPAMAGPSGAQTATHFQGSISGTTLTVTAVSQGQLAVGQTVFGKLVNISTTITGLGSGSGGAGTYTVSSAQTTAPGAMAAVRSPALAQLGGAWYPEMASIVEVVAAPAAVVFNGSIQGDVLTVNGAVNGTIATGQYVVGVGIPEGTTVLGPGSVRGTYRLSQEATVSTETLAVTGAQMLTVALRNPNGTSGVMGSYAFLFQGGVAGQAISFDDNLAATQMRTSYLALGSLTGHDLIYTINLKGGQQGIDSLPKRATEAETIHSGYHLYPSCEILENMSIHANPECEPNEIPWAVGDVVENPHNPMVNVEGFHLFIVQDTPTNGAGSSLIAATAQGTGVGANFSMSAVRNGNPASYYLANQGWMSPPRGYQLIGLFQNSFMTQFGPPPGGCLVCAYVDYPATTPGPYTVLGVPGFQLTYNPATRLLASALDAPAPLLQGALAAGTPSFVAGPGVASVGCAAGYRCTNSEGELAIRASAATTGTIATINFSNAPLAAAPGLCTVTQNGGSGFYGIGHGVASTISVAITAGMSLAGMVVLVDYRCTP